MLVKAGKEDSKPVVEIAVAVNSEYQRLGIGLHLATTLFGIAQAEGVGTVVADFLSGNSKVVELFRRAARQHAVEPRLVGREAGVLSFEFPLGERLKVEKEKSP